LLSTTGQGFIEAVDNKKSRIDNGKQDFDNRRNLL